MATDLKVCVRTTLPIDAEMEGAMVNYFYNLTDTQHRDMGFAGSPNTYIYGSWLWRRLSYMNRYENDFSDRLAMPPWQGGTLYAKSNKSLNFPKQFVKSHHASATGDLENYGWFAVAPEGGEDEHPALPLWERYLREKAKRMNLGMLLKNESARPALIRGEFICQVNRKRTLRVEPRMLRAVKDLTQPGEVPLRDSRKQIVTELDVWVENPINPAEFVLQRDPKVFRSKETPLELTKGRYKVNHVIQDETGASIDFIHPGDFVFDLTRSNLNECVKVGSVVGRFFRLAVDDLFDQYSEEDLTAEGREYKQRFGRATGNLGGTAAQETPKQKQGESPNSADHFTDQGAMPLRLYFEGYFRYDWNQDNRREYVYMLIDWEQRLPIAYDPTTLVLQSDQRTHPYKMGAINKKSFRAYGEGIYEAFNDLSESADQNYNRIFIEQQTSGKIVGFDRGGFTQTWAGKPLELRGTTLWEKRQPDKSLREIVDVMQIPAETGELRNNMTFDIQTMAARGGGVSPAEAEQAGLQGAQTATGLQILERQKNSLDGSIVDDLNDAHQELVQTWAQEEALAFDVGFAQKLFGEKTVPTGEMQPAAAPEGMPTEGPEGMEMPEGAETAVEPAETGQPEQAPGPELQAGVPASPQIQMVPVEVPAWQMLAEWIRSVEPDEMASLIKLNLVKTKESEIASRADNRVKLITQYAGLDPQMQQAVEGEFIQLLTLNGAQDAEKTLKDIQAATQQKMAQMQAQQAIQAGAAGAGAPGTPMPPEEPPPVTGRPQKDPEAEEQGEEI